jgi:hypothetical protein
MNPEESNFYELRKLMAIKRHEQPPPGYFNRLHANIAAAIHEPADESLWIRLRDSFSIKPILGAAFGIAIFSSLGFGLFHSVTTKPSELAYPVGNLAEMRPLADLVPKPVIETTEDFSTPNPVLEHFVQPVSLHGSSLAAETVSMIRQ